MSNGRTLLRLSVNVTDILQVFLFVGTTEDVSWDLEEDIKKKHEVLLNFLIILKSVECCAPVSKAGGIWYGACVKP